MDNVTTKGSSADYSSEINPNHSSFRLLLKGFAEETTAHGIPHVIVRPKIISKLFWSTLVVIALVVFSLQTYKLALDYYAFNTKINLINSQSVEFPAVTVCNLNRMKRSLLLTSDRWADIMNFEKIPEKIDRPKPGRPNPGNFGSFPYSTNNGRPNPGIGGSFPYSTNNGRPNPGIGGSFPYSTNNGRPNPGIGGSFPYPTNNGLVDIFEIIRSSTANDTEEDDLERNKRADDEYDWYYDSMQDVKAISPMTRSSFGAKPAPPEIPTPTRQELRDMGHRAEDLIVKCKFNNRKCDHTNFITSQNQHYGNCFTFNGDESFQRVTKAGSNFGLHMTLFIEYDEYVGGLTEDSGVRVMSHPKNIMPNPEDVGLSLSPGFSTNIGIRQVEIKRLPYPHGSCTEGEHTNYLMTNRYNYSILSCQKKCFLDKLASNCSCVVDMYDEYEEIPVCNRTQRICRQKIEKLYYSNTIGCDCPAPCWELIYNTQTTFSRWPGNMHYEYFRNEVFESGNRQAYRALEDIQAARDNFVKVKIYFQELNYELVEQVEANTLESVLGTTGGLLGLYIGFSLLTVVEIFIFFYDVIALMCKRVLFT